MMLVSCGISVSILTESSGHDGALLRDPLPCRDEIRQGENKGAQLSLWRGRVWRNARLRRSQSPTPSLDMEALCRLNHFLNPLSS